MKKNLVITGASGGIGRAIFSRILERQAAQQAVQRAMFPPNSPTFYEKFSYANFSCKDSSGKKSSSKQSASFDPDAVNPDQESRPHFRTFDQSWSSCRLFLHANRRLAELNEEIRELGFQECPVESPLPGSPLHRFVSTPEEQLTGVEIWTLQGDLTEEAAQDHVLDTVFSHIPPSETIDAWIQAAGIDLMASTIRPLPFDAKLQLLLKLDVTAAVRMTRRVGNFLRSRRRSQNAVNQNGSRWASDSPPSTETGHFPNENSPKEGPDAASLTLGENLSSNMRGNSPALSTGPAPLLLFFGWDGIDRGMEGETAQLYSLGKGALVAFSRSLAQELAPDVRVCSISPGWIKTTWGQKASTVMIGRGKSESLLERWGEADEIAAVVEFLMSDAASYLNAQNLILNGGFNYRTPPQTS